MAKKRSTHIPSIMLPNEEIDLQKWSVVACDQYTSEPEYWAETESIVGDSASTLHITLPEVYLEGSDTEARIDAIHSTMRRYLSDGTLLTLPRGMMLVRRDTGAAHARLGLVLALDLEDYEYKPNCTPQIRPTEKTVVERIPPRLKVRTGACMELPHIMILIDDPDRAIIEPLLAHTDAFEQMYDTDLMQNGGHITGWLIPEGDVTAEIEDKLAALSDADAFRKKYKATEAQVPFAYAVGDGNHSMATAKAYWENLKPSLSDAEKETHPARFALVELNNVHDESILIEPIHRVLFDVDANDLLSCAKSYFEAKGCTATLTTDTRQCTETEQAFPYLAGDKRGSLVLQNAPFALPLASLQDFLDDYMSRHASVKIDYIHGMDVLERLSTKDGNMGFLLPDIEKNDLFRGIVFDGVLPRKTFSMGEANEKRYYMEVQQIAE